MQIKKKYFILVLFLLLGVNFAKAHPFYVSICQVNYNSETKSLEISVKVFADDLLLGLKNTGRTKIYLGEEKEDPKTDEYIFDYLNTQFSFVANGEKVNFKFVGKEIENDAVWTYLEIENVADLTSIYVECKLLTEVLESQSNIIQVNKSGEIKNLLLNKNKVSGSITFE